VVNVANGFTKIEKKQNWKMIFFNDIAAQFVKYLIGLDTYEDHGDILIRDPVDSQFETITALFDMHYDQLDKINCILEW